MGSIRKTFFEDNTIKVRILDTKLECIDDKSERQDDLKLFRMAERKSQKGKRVLKGNPVKTKKEEKDELPS